MIFIVPMTAIITPPWSERANALKILKALTEAYLTWLRSNVQKDWKEAIIGYNDWPLAVAS